MRIERHEIDEKALNSALDGFAERIAGDVDRMQHDEFQPEYGWELISDAFLDYLGARSVASPDLAGKDARVACESAAEARVGALALGIGLAGPPHVFIDYTGTGVVYDEDPGIGKAPKAAEGDWLDAFFVAFVAGAWDQHAELFLDAAAARRGDEGRPALALVHGLLAFVGGYVEGRNEDGGPMSDAERSTAVDAIADEVADGSDDPLRRAALTTLRALAAGDHEAFTGALAAQLTAYREWYEQYAAISGPPPRSLLPLDAIALAAMARRWNGWAPGVDSPYLPAAPVAGFPRPEPRVGTYGRRKRPEALDALEAGVLVVDRPEHPAAAGWDTAVHDEFTRHDLARFRDAAAEPRRAVHSLTYLAHHQALNLPVRIAADPEGRDPALHEAIRTGAEAGGAAFRLARAEEGTEHEITLDGTTRLLPALRSAAPGTGDWKEAVALALIAGQRQPLADCVLASPEFFAEGDGPVDAYCAALHDYLRGADPVPAVDRALAVCFQHERGTYHAPPVRLLSQLVEGDREGFALALADALEEHREHYTLGALAGEADALLDLDILALVCHARRLGWDIPVRSPYLPAGIIR